MRKALITLIIFILAVFKTTGEIVAKEKEEEKNLQKSNSIRRRE